MIEAKIEMNITYFCDNYKHHIIQLKTILQNPETHLLESEIKELKKLIKLNLILKSLLQKPKHFKCSI